MEYVKVINTGESFTTHPRALEYGCSNYQQNIIPDLNKIYKVIRNVIINEDTPHISTNGFSIDYEGLHFLIGTRGVIGSTKEEYDAQFQPQELIQQLINQPEIKIEQKMKVKCINQGNFKNITKGNEYEVFYDNGNTWTVTSDDLSNRTYNKKYFELIPEPAIEDVDEVGVEEEPQPEFTVDWNREDGSDIDVNVNENKVTLQYYQTAGNCGVVSYHGVNYLYENCDENDTLFKDVIKAIIELVESRNNTCMLIFSTNYEYQEIWDILNEVMDFSSEVVENPNSDMNVKLWIKYTN